MTLAARAEKSQSWSVVRE